MKRLCSCGRLVEKGERCVCRATRPRKDTRPSAARRGYDKAWARAASAYLARPENKRCAKCGAPAEVVMHIISIRKRPDLRMVEANWRPGCRRCNALEAHADRRTRG